MVERDGPQGAVGSWRDEVDALFDRASVEKWKKELTGPFVRRHPRLASYAEHMVAEAIGRAYERWRADPGKAGRPVPPYLQTILRNLANDAYKVVVAEKVTDVPEAERPFVPKPTRASDLLLDIGGDRPHPPVDPLYEVVIPAIARMKETGRKTVAEMQSRGMEDDAIAERMNRSVTAIQNLKSRAYEELGADPHIRLHIREERSSTTPRREEGEEA